MSTRALTIEQLERKFAIWRDKKQHTGRTIPEKLWVKVKTAIHLHGAGPVLRRLGISWKQARQKGLLPTEPGNDSSKKPNISSAFIRIPQALPITHDRPAQLIFQCGEAQLLLSEPSNEQLQLIITMLKAMN